MQFQEINLSSEGNVTSLMSLIGWVPSSGR